MWGLDHKESWVLKNRCFQIVVLEKTLESPLNCKDIKPVNPKGNQSWIFIGRTDAKTEAPILWPPDVMNWFIGKDLCWESLKAKEKGEDRGWDGWMASLTRWTWVLTSSRKLVMEREAWYAVVHGITKNQAWLSGWTELIVQVTS